MTIIASADIRLNYNSVVEKCRESGEPVYLTKNGQGELVVMDIASFEKREQELALRQSLLEAYAADLAGERRFSNNEAFELVDKMLAEKQ